MINLKLLLHKKRIKKLLFLGWPLLLILTMLGMVFLLGDVGKDDGWKTLLGIIFALFSIGFFHIQFIVIYFYFDKYLKNKEPFFIFYFLFFIFYFLNTLDIVYFIFPLVFLLFVFRIKNKNIIFILKRYGFAILVALISLGMHLIKIYFIRINIEFSKEHSQEIIDFYYAYFHTPRDFYSNEIYLLSFLFFIIQLIIEAYYFYQKEKPKWIRYARMRKYRRQKDYSEKL